MIYCLNHIARYFKTQHKIFNFTENEKNNISRDEKLLTNQIILAKNIFLI